MLEAVNSVLSNAALVKGATPIAQSSQQAKSSVKSDYIKVESTNYISRHVTLDDASQRTVLKIRNSSTGASLKQFPTESQIRAYMHAQEVINTAKPIVKETGNTPPTGAQPVENRPAPSPVEQKALDNFAPKQVESKPVEAEVKTPTPTPTQSPIPSLGEHLSKEA